MRTHPDRWGVLFYVAAGNFGVFMVLEMLGIRAIDLALVASGWMAIAALVIYRGYALVGARNQSKEEVSCGQ